MPYSSSELMIITAARELAGARVVFVGVGLPNIACNLAQRTVAPSLELVYESGVYGAQPRRMPLSIGDPCLVTGAMSVMSMSHLFQYYLQGGLIDVGFLGAAQIDRFGNLNSTVIGDYAQPDVRLPGSGGACEIALHARKIFVIARVNPRTFVEELDFRTSPGHLTGSKGRDALGVGGHGPAAVITDMGILRFDPDSNEMMLAAIHPDFTITDIQDRVSWSLRIADDLIETPMPTTAELSILRTQLDLTGRYR